MKDKHAKGEHCLFCGNTLNCEGCNGKAQCLGEPYYNFCSNRCAENWMEIQKMKLKVRNFWWQHPFRSLAVAGSMISLVCAFIFVINNLNLIQASFVSGILLIAIAGTLGLICSGSK